MNPKSFFLLALALYTFSCRSTRISGASGATYQPPTDSTWAAFESKIERLRLRYHIPGLSAGVVYGGKLIWKKGFGYADVDLQMVPDEHTVYQIASLTKTFGSIILMQLVEAGKIILDDAVQQYGIRLGGRWSGDTSIKIKHLLTHTAMGTTWNGFKPGYRFRYNGDWYAQLGKAIKKASGHPFGELLVDQIIRPLQMSCTAPSLDDSIDFALTGYDRAAFAARVAKPYDWQHGRLVAIRRFKYGFSPAAGIMSCVSDLALYASAIDEGDF